MAQQILNSLTDNAIKNDLKKLTTLQHFKDILSVAQKYNKDKYRTMALKYHPDRNVAADASRVMKILNALKQNEENKHNSTNNQTIAQYLNAKIQQRSRDFPQQISRQQLQQHLRKKYSDIDANVYRQKYGSDKYQIILKEIFEKYPMYVRKFTMDSYFNLDLPIENLQNLKVLVCQRLRTIYDYRKLASKLQYLKDLEILCLREGIIRSSASTIAAVLPSLDKLKQLDLSYSRVGNEGGVEIAKALPFLKNLQTLDISNNQIGKEGMIAIIQALVYLPHLKNIDISKNLSKRHPYDPNNVRVVIDALPVQLQRQLSQKLTKTLQTQQLQRRQRKAQQQNS